jgi:hypothetical protein
MRGILLVLLAFLPAAAQDFNVVTLSRHVMTNDGVITMAKAGFDELFIIERIHTSRTHFDTSVEGLVALKLAGVSEDVIRVMAAQDVRSYPLPVPAAPAGSVEASKVMLEKHWWGYRWVRVTR